MKGGAVISLAHTPLLLISIACPHLVGVLDGPSAGLDKGPALQQSNTHTCIQTNTLFDRERTRTRRHTRYKPPALTHLAVRVGRVAINDDLLVEAPKEYCSLGGSQEGVTVDLGSATCKSKQCKNRARARRSN